MNLVKNKYIVAAIMAVGVLLMLFHFEGVPFSLIQMLVGLIIVLLVGEPMVEGLKEFGSSFGLSPHITGVISSLASNLPEGVMTYFMIMSRSSERWRYSPCSSPRRSTGSSWGSSW